MPQLEYWASMSPGQYTALALIAKVSGTCSFLMSCCVAIAIVRRTSRQSYHRLFLGIAVADMISSPVYIVGSWAIPTHAVLLERYPDQVDDLQNLPWNSGSHASCQIQGFLTQFSSATCFYTASLMAYFYLVLRNRWKESAIRRVELYLHIGPITAGLLSATAALGLDLYGPVPPICYISKHKGLYWLLFMYVPGWTFFLVATCANLLIYRHVHSLERRSDRFGFSQQQTTVFQQSSPEEDVSNSAEQPDPERRPAFVRRLSMVAAAKSPLHHSSGAVTHGVHTQEVLQQCILFGLANCLHFSGAVIQSLEWLFTGGLSFATSLIAFFTLPLFGLPSGLVFFRPKFLTLRQQHPDYSVCRLMFDTVWHVDESTTLTTTTTATPEASAAAGGGA